MIDRIEMTTFPQSIILSVRDVMKRALDQVIQGVLSLSRKDSRIYIYRFSGESWLIVGTAELTGLTLASIFITFPGNTL